MATEFKPGSFTFELPDTLKGKVKVGIAVAAWNPEITGSLLSGCKTELQKAGIAEENILVHEIPGSYELPLAAQFLIEHAHVDAAICIGCLIKGETAHFHYISESVALHINTVALKYNKPVAFGVLTVDTLQQAQDRSGGKYGNKGEEAGQAIIQMLALKENLKTNKPRTSVGFGTK